MRVMIMQRRSLLIGGAAGLGAALLGCSTNSPSPSPGAASPTPAPRSADAALAEIEARFGGRVGVHAVDTGTGTTVGHRGDERFLMCSTAKVPLAALVLHRSVHEPDLLERRIHYTRGDLLDYAPVTTRNLATGMTVAELCEATVTASDNTAANLLYGLVGGPGALTAFVRDLGDPHTRFDHIEPMPDVVAPGDERDTTTPAWFAHTLRVLTQGGAGDALPPAQQNRLVGWMLANTTGSGQIRAGVPDGWRVGDKTGSCSGGMANDVAVLWPPERAPVVLTVFTAPTDPENPNGKPTIAAATRATLEALSSSR